MADSRVEDLMKKYPPWFMFGFHPIRSDKRIYEQEERIERETNEAMGEQREV